MSILNIKHIFEPTPLQCGQAVLAMITNNTVEQIIIDCNTERETNFNHMKNVLNKYRISIISQRTPVDNKEQLPKIALLSLETPKCWHWSLYVNNMFYDPEYGLIDDFPPTNRRYYWEIKVK